MEAIIYGGAGALVIGYTVYTLTLSWTHTPESTIVFACLYGFAMVSTVFSWIYGFKHAAEAREVLEPKPQPASAGH
jgi:nitrate/nitrite transporter NarK